MTFRTKLHKGHGIAWLFEHQTIEARDRSLRLVYGSSKLHRSEYQKIKRAIDHTRRTDASVPGFVFKTVDYNKL